MKSAYRGLAVSTLFAGLVAAGCNGPPPAGGGSEPELPKTPDELATGELVYNDNCMTCHSKTTQWSAPRLGFLRAWKSRLEKGEDKLVAGAIAGVGEMPPRGDNPELTDEQIRSVVQYMIYRAKLDIPAG